jgi:hypothetical protein
MRELIELPADLLDDRLAAAHEPEDTSAATRISHVAQLADRGEHQAAAREAAGLIEARIYDVRLIGFYLFGVFLQRGIACLPTLLGRISTLVTDDLAALRPGRRKLQVVNSATAWLFEHVSSRLQFHTKQRDATWDAWRAASDSALVDAIAAGCTGVTLALETVIDAPLAATPLARIRRWTNDDLRRAAARRETAVARAAAAAPVAAPHAPAPDPHPSADPDPDTIAGQREDAAEVPEEPPLVDAWPDDPPDDQADDPADDLPDAWPAPWPDGSPERVPDAPAVAAAGRARTGDRPVRAGSPDEVLVVGSPALATLQAKLRGFQDLVARGELAKAAVVASDVRAVLANFDPVTFFPAMFAAYFKALHRAIDELAPYFDGVDLPSWHALDSYYRADMRGFFDD